MEKSVKGSATSLIISTLFLVLHSILHILFVTFTFDKLRYQVELIVLKSFSSEHNLLETKDGFAVVLRLISTKN